MRITKAIIPVAGWGARRLPITKAIEKCMLPIGNRPIVDYVVESCIEAGIKDIYFIVGEDSQQIRRFYGENPTLMAALAEKGKTDEIAMITPDNSVSYHFITQSSAGKYGTAVPVALASEYIDDGESALVLMGDDFIYHEGGGISDIQRLVESAEPGSAAMIGVSVPRETVSRYGVLKLNEQSEYESIVEKPPVEEAPSTLINISKYLLPKELIDAACDVEINPARDEYEITDVVNQFVSRGGSVKVIESTGQYLDGGSLEGWLHANNVVCA